MVRLLVFLWAYLLAATSAHAGEWNFGGDLQGEMRYFQNDAIFEDQFNHWDPSFAIIPDVSWRSENGVHNFQATPFLRVDGRDAERTHWDLREFYYRYQPNSVVSVTLGATQVFWGRAESHHLIDIINQRDQVEDIDDEDKLGQPMINIAFDTRFGTLNMYAMTGFRDRTFPGSDGRLRFFLPFDTDNPVFDEDGGRYAPEYAFRYDHKIADVEFGLAYFEGNSREPRIGFSVLGDGLIPIYDKIKQGSVDFLYTRGNWQGKFEGLFRNGYDESFFAFVGGVEYTFPDVLGTDADVGFLLEYQYDGREVENIDEPFGPALSAPLTLNDHDAYGAMRVTLSEEQRLSALAGFAFDTDDESIRVTIEASKEIGENWTAEIESRVLMGTESDDIIHALRNDDFVTFRLTRRF
ncbi:MAG: hypothetical protein AAGC77_01775 [Pseudomonadota bacterium]